ncbi:(deoxy)nucleoside triphosphate pyrophosphohydrolase [Luteibaculum oceani]|uniref:8-oxo-dGTP diphosphatase n=1 Tax=Luteibaculum oceani TaxID=1294296 RepID=A0A5C6VKT1_9FLAO|nr:(deoxy)nucleoside triphosphate pyrophosphohydrolase [Luteibaculum oceani]TXC85371.1 (deoxy)nucleoside triphosphate pyrophosphohydrolase [Luteibaculum oceani]
MDVACAIITSGNKILAAQRAKERSMGGFWEFPGGKIETGENAFEAIIREIKEELDLIVVPSGRFNPTRVFDPINHIVLEPVCCKIISGNLTLKEHEEVQWLEAQDLKLKRWTPADAILLPAIIQYLEPTPNFRTAKRG